MHTRERNSVLSFIYKGFRAFSGLFLYASPDAYKCIHAYRTGLGGRHDWLYKWTLYTHTGALARKILAKDVGLSEVEIREILK